MRQDIRFRTRDRGFLLGRRTWIMGILNVTPDSFSDGGLLRDAEAAVERGLALAADGADIIDVGGESTRPGAEPVPAEEEIRRVIPVVDGLRKHSKVLISVDTTKSQVARRALDAGADIINDVSALRFDPDLAGVIAEARAGLVLMNMKGTPRTMQAAPFYEDLLAEVRGFLESRLREAVSAGIAAESVLLDPGIGFGKRLEHNLTLINRLDVFADLGRPLVLGTSRKSFIGKILNAPLQERLEGSIASAVLGVVRGAHVLRVHDVREVGRAIRVAEAIRDEEPEPDSKGHVRYVS
ncbi:MAG: dihydropteroate synthase [Candidatus Aminicenantes bacterium]|nr:dihydropteroate synthase [Candidatus Aminicenantes bacterium]